MTPYTNRGANVLRVRYVGLPPAGNGDGLRGEYYDNADFTNLKFVRTNATVDFNWGAGSPDPAIGPDTFSVRWTGQVQPQFSETYTFNTLTDDGVRLWVNGQLLVDRWVDQSATEWGGSLALTAYKRYDIKMEYYENGGDAAAQLSWSSPSTPKTVIPQSQLYSGPNQPLPFYFPSIAQPSNGLVQLALTGVPGDVQQIEVSTNLMNWTLLMKLTNITGLVTFSVPVTNGLPHRFFRSVISQPPYPAEIIIDNPSAAVAGAWSSGNTDVDKYGPDYLFKTNGTGSAYVQFTPNLATAGNYQVYEWHTQASDHTTNAPLVVAFNGGSQTNSVNQQVGGGYWNLIGTYDFAAGTTGYVRITDAIPDAGRKVLADAIKFIYLGP